MFDDWTRRGRVCLSKALLDALAGGRDLGLDLYTKYLDNSTLVDSDLCFSGLSRFGLANRSVISTHQYKNAEPATEPAHWSVRSECDVNRAAGMVGCLIVVFVYDPPASEPPAPTADVADDDYWLERAGRDSRRFWLWHDSRPRHVQRGEAEKRVRAFLATSGKTRQLYELSAGRLSEFEDLAHVWFSETAGPASKTCVSVSALGGDYLAAVDALLGIELADDDDDDDAVEPFGSLQDFFLSDRSRLHRRWKSASSCVAVLAYTRREGNGAALSAGNAKKGRKPVGLRFTCLAIASEFSPDDSHRDFADHATPDAVVVCFYGQDHACLLQDPYRSMALAAHLDTRGLSQRLFNRTDLSGVAKKLPESVVREAEQRRKEKKEAKRGGGTARKRPKRRCRCGTCRSPKYRENMSASGPDRLCTAPYSLSDLLSLLGALDDDARLVVSKMVELSVASMDIESRTFDVDLEGPRPGYLVEYPEIGGPILEGHVFKAQQPIMVGHTDFLSRQRGDKWHDTVKDDSPEAVYALFSRYWLKVCKLQAEAKEAKSKLAESIKEMAARYSEAYCAFFNAWVKTSEIERDHHHACRAQELTDLRKAGRLDDDTYNSMLDDAFRRYCQSDEWAMPTPGQAGSAFFNTLPGQLMKRLGALVSRYVVFNFYG